MKKSLFAIFVCLTSFFALCSCSGFSKFKSDVSEYRDNVYLGQSEHFTAQAVTGYREEPFKIDGASGEKSDFCLVTITPHESSMAAYKYSIAIDGVKYEGDCVKHPFENTYSFEAPARCTDPTISVTVGGETIELNTVKNENFIDGEKAFEIALKRLGEDEVIRGGNYEIYIRLIENPVSAAGGYFWYVAFVNTDKDICAALIAPESMEIIAVRE